MAIDRDGDGPPLSRDDARAAKPADGLRASPFTEDVFDDEYYGRRRRGSGIPFGVIAGIVFVAAVVAVAGWYIMGERNASTAGEGPGLIVKADPSPYKIKPDDPGGMQVDNQDKLIYDRVAKGAPPSRVENLLPAPEEPHAPPAAPKAEPPAPTVPVAPKAVSSTPSTAPAPSAVAAAPAPAAVAPAPTATASAKPAAKADADPMASLMAQVESMKKPSTPDDTPPTPPETKSATPSAAPAAPMLLVPAAPANPEPTQSTPVVASASPPPVPPAAAATPAPTATTPISAPATGTAFVQLVSVQSQEAAMSEWKRLNAKNADLLAGLAPTVVQAEVPDKGTYFRLRAGPLTDKAAAEALCASLKSRNVGCNVVRP